MFKKVSKPEFLIITVINIVFIISIVLLFYGLFAKSIPGEAYIGDFSSTSFNDSWTLYDNGQKQEVIELPYEVKDSAYHSITIEKTLPSDITDGMRLSFRTKMANVSIYVDGKLRETYGGGDIPLFTKYPPSAYLFSNLYHTDAGKVVSIQFDTVEDLKLREISLAYGNNAWFDVIRDNLLQFTIAVIMIILGIISIAGAIIIRKQLSTDNSIFILGQTITLFGIWILNESALRQMVFGFPTITSILSYVTLEVIIVFVLRYFDEVQERAYHRFYFPLEVIATIQMTINMILALTNIVDAHDSLRLSHITMIICILTGMILILKDVINKNAQNYRVASTGMLLFLLFGILEIAMYYFLPFYSLGVCICIGLVLLLVATVIQVFDTTIRREITRRQETQKEALMTIETIAGSLDAKDEYTGGHSERVAYYAKCLAREIAPKYGFTSEDISWVEYNGLLHDIGKIGIPDKILNKIGKLTDDEYLLIKQHPSIGDSLLHGTHFLSSFSDGVRHHHERYDGKGYPDGLKGDEIPLIAKILCLADSYDAMTSNRIYRKRISDQDVLDEIKRCSGTQFDPELADIFCKMISEGSIKPQTKRGMEIDSEGNTRKYSILRNLLADDLIEGRRIIANPPYVTMVSYIIKMSEAKGAKVNVFLIGVKGPNNEMLYGEELNSAKSRLGDTLGKVASVSDICIEYSSLKYLVIWFELSEEEISQRLESVSDSKDPNYKITVEEIL